MATSKHRLNDDGVGDGNYNESPVAKAIKIVEAGETQLCDLIRVKVKIYSAAKAQRNDPASCATETARLLARLHASLPRNVVLEKDPDDIEDAIEEATASLSGAGESLDPSHFPELPWLEPIDAFAFPRKEGAGAFFQTTLGSCVAKLIRRDQMRGVFHDQICQATTAMAQMGFTLFDRYGRLDRDFKMHPIKRGTGIWGREFDTGDMLLIEGLQVSEPYRRQGLGSKLIKALLEKTRKKSPKKFFAITQPDAMTREMLLQDPTKDSSDEALAVEVAAVIAFFRSLGFRRVGSTSYFAWTSIPIHHSRGLASNCDYNPPVSPVDIRSRDVAPLFDAFKQLNDHACLTKLHQVFPTRRMNDTRWLSRDSEGNTILHAAAIHEKAHSVGWIIAECAYLLKVRNYNGDTPLETLQWHIERSRRRIIQPPSTFVPVSDSYTGCSDAHVLCLRLLINYVNPHPDDIPRVKFGCTCSYCIAGFFSPRMVFNIFEIASSQRNVLREPDPVRGWLDHLDHFPTLLFSLPGPDLQMDRASREGYMQICDAFASCLARSILPTYQNIMLTLDAAEDGIAVEAYNYVEQGGDVKAVAAMMFSMAMKEDEWAGNGRFQNVMREKWEKVPICRNDQEFAFASYNCGLFSTLAV
ncbi:hypothetical protein G7046_g3319 [Stylonectria norvegica]|nr:hypothetical protein G7046_g3319 [Stylonectria norvegica]